jgi:hypothetical protein
MKNIYKLIGTIVLSFNLVVPNLVLIAQESSVTSILNDNLDSSGLNQGQLVNCFDTYKFQNIDISSGLSQSIYNPGDMVEISADIFNKNTYPIIDAEVRAKILKSHPNPVEDRAKYITIDDIILKDNLILKPNESYNLKYDYFIPVDATGGDYIVQYYIYNQDRFNLAGLSFTEDVVGNITSFSVEGKFSDIYLDKTNITVDGKIHNSRGFMTQHESNKNIPVKLPLINSTSENQEMEVSYKLYKWDSILENNFIKEEKQVVIVNANSKLSLEYNIEAQEEPVYYLVITAKKYGELAESTAKKQTMAHIRFAIEGENKPRINWVGLDKYPFKKGDEVQLVVCAHNTSNSTDLGPIRILSVVRDIRGRILTRVDYEGKMLSAVSGLSNTFKVDRSLNIVNIETSIYNSNNELVDNIKTTYNCKDINPELCSDESNFWNIFITIISIIGISAGVVMFIRYNKLKK